MRLCDINREAEDAWVYIPPRHKKSQDGKIRMIPMTRDCRNILESYVNECEGCPEEYFFNPNIAIKMLAMDKARKRKTKVQPSQQLRKANAKGRKFNDHYTRSAYIRAIERAAKKAGVPKWPPHQLRKLKGTDIFRVFGIEVVRQTLGHDSTKTTEIYIDADALTEAALEKARELTRKLNSLSSKTA